MIKAFIFFTIGLVFLIKGGDWFVDGATGIAKKFNIPEILIGATVVSIGTTLPEVMVSAGAAMTGHSEIAYGNAIGSIICNTALISALTIAVSPSIINKKTLIKPVFFFFIAALYYVLNSYIFKGFSRLSGIILLLMFVIYMIIIVIDAKKEISSSKEEKSNDENLLKDVLLLVIGAILIALGAKLLVDNGTLIAEGLGVPESVIALTMVALGTSLPELVTAISSLRKGRGLLSLGNIIGANLFNLVLVNGVAATVAPYHIPENYTRTGLNMTLAVELPVMVFVMMALVLPGMLRGKLTRVQGIVLLAVYVGFCVFQFTC